jgi:ribosomal protein L24E
MSIEDTIGYQNDVECCVVCGKNVEHSGGFAKVNHRGIMVNLCCPHCMETFEKEPGPHMARLAKIESYRARKQPEK